MNIKLGLANLYRGLYKKSIRRYGGAEMEIKPLIKMKRTNKLSGRCNRLYLIMRSKFLLSFFLLVLVPFCILAVIIQVKSIYSVMELQSKNTVVNIDRYFNDIEKISDVLAKDEFVRSIKGNPAQITDVNISLNKEVISLKDYMKMKISSFTDANISSVSYYSILSNKPAVLYTKFSNIIVNNDSWSKNWVSYFENNADKTEYIGTALQFFDNGRNEYIFSTAKAVKNIESGKFDGIIKIDFDYNDLNKIISSSISLNTKNNETYLVKSYGDSDDPNDVFANTIMYSNNKGVLTSEINANILDMIGEEKSGTQFSLPEEHGPTFITYRTCSSLPWKFIQIYPGISILGDSYFIDFKWSIIIIICFILIFVFLFVV
ncbi:MAG: cache domain-containing protein, partial [Bacillota bacterium]|nr:cache domain-containing protein [Bacillota bacterium]